jgi:uncharacterized protein YndB with AHSA1/START domain
MIAKSVILRCDPARAFLLVTESAGQWWPAGRRHTDDENSAIRIEPAGRFFERASDGTEIDLGVVRIYEPATRLVLDWYPGTGPDNATRVEIRFEAVERGTRVTVVHDAGAAGTEAFSGNVAAYELSWDSVLAALAGAT